MSSTATRAWRGRAQGSRGGGGVVEVARATERIPHRVVAGRPGERVRGRLAAEDQVRRGERHVERPARRLPGTRADQGHGVVREPAGAGGDRGRRDRRRACRRPRREGVGDDARLAGVLVEPGRLPLARTPLRGSRAACDREPATRPRRDGGRRGRSALRRRRARRGSPRRGRAAPSLACTRRPRSHRPVRAGGARRSTPPASRGPRSEPTMPLVAAATGARRSVQPNERSSTAVAQIGRERLRAALSPHRFPNDRS